MRKFFKKIKYKIKYYISPVPQPEKWIFIAGCSNSGTTLLHKILSQHSMIGSLPDEGQFCTNQLPLNRNLGEKRLWAVPTDKMYFGINGGKDVDLIKLKKQWAARMNHPRRPILMEKSPPNTVRLLWLQKNFPNTYFIGIYRNGYAVAEGIKRKAGHPVSLGATQWNNANTILLNDFEKLENKILISYERLTEKPLETLQEICDFLKISPLTNSMINQKFNIHGNLFQIKNLNQKSIENLSREEFLSIENHAGDMLKRLDYIIQS